MELSSIRGQLIEYTPKTVLYEQKVQSISERIISEIPVQIINSNNDFRSFVSPQTVSLTVIGGMEFIANLEANDILVTVDFNDWKPQQQFYNIDKNILANKIIIGIVILVGLMIHPPKIKNFEDFLKPIK